LNSPRKFEVAADNIEIYTLGDTNVQGGPKTAVYFGCFVDKAAPSVWENEIILANFKYFPSS